MLSKKNIRLFDLFYRTKLVFEKQIITPTQYFLRPNHRRIQTEKTFFSRVGCTNSGYDFVSLFCGMGISLPTWMLREGAKRYSFNEKNILSAVQKEKLEKTGTL